MKRRRLQSYLFSFYLKTMVKINKIMTLPCYNLILLLFSEKKKVCIYVYVNVYVYLCKTYSK